MERELEILEEILEEVLRLEKDSDLIKQIKRRIEKIKEKKTWKKNLEE